MPTMSRKRKFLLPNGDSTNSARVYAREIVKVTYALDQRFPGAKLVYTDPAIGVLWKGEIVLMPHSFFVAILG